MGPGSVAVGGNLQEKLECQACPRGTVFVSRQRGELTMCRPCPAGTWMDKEGATHNNAGEAGECNACPSPAHMTNVFPAYTQDQCAKSSCFPNRTKFQVVFALDSSGSVTRPDYIRMREFAKQLFPECVSMQAKMVENHVVMLDMLFTTVHQNLSLNSNKLKTMTTLPELIITNTVVDHQESEMYLNLSKTGLLRVINLKLEFH